jgi:dTMP kinase
MNKFRRGKFLVCEGADGSGKSTNAPYLVEKLNQLGIQTILTREVGSTPIGQVLRGLVYADTTDEILDPVSRLLLIYAARIQNIKHVVEPALAQGITVVSDRFADSTFVYQGYEDGLRFLIKDFESIEEIKYLGQRPDYLLFFDISAETSIARGKTRGAVDNSRYKGNLERAERIVSNYRNRMAAMARIHPQPIIHIDAEKTQDHVCETLDTFAYTLRIALLKENPPVAAKELALV